MAVIKIARTVALDAPILTEALHGTLFTTEGSAHEFTISCTQGGAAVTLTGTVTAKFIREESGDTILCAGSLSAGAAKVTLPADCYHRSGRFSLTVFVTSGSVATVVYACTGTVKAAEDGTLIDEGTITPSYEEILQQLASLNSNKVSKSGDTMTGDLTIKGGSWPTYGFKRSDGTNLGALWASASSGRVILRTWDSTGTYYVDYNLPDDSNNTANRVRYLLTTKEFPYTSKDQSSATMTGLVNGRGTWLVTALDGGDASKYYVGLIFHQDNNTNPVNTTLVNNGLNYSWGNTIGTCVFAGATGNYIVKAVKLTE